MFSDLNQNVRYRVYAIIPHEQEEDQRWYVGCTSNLRVRLTNHLRSGLWQYPFSWAVLDKSERGHWRHDRSAMENYWMRVFGVENLRNINGTGKLRPIS